MFPAAFVYAPKFDAAVTRPTIAVHHLVIEIDDAALKINDHNRLQSMGEHLGQMVQAPLRLLHRVDVHEGQNQAVDNVFSRTVRHDEQKNHCPYFNWTSVCLKTKVCKASRQSLPCHHKSNSTPAYADLRNAAGLFHSFLVRRIYECGYDIR